VSPARRDPGTTPDTKLAHARMGRGMTQDELADAIGLSIATYRRLERGQTDNPPLRYLVNAAIVLGVELDALVEDQWRTWWRRYPDDPAEPEDPSELWRRPYRP
jgi:transcriptional regulator with XRE-family HTH domain